MDGLTIYPALPLRQRTTLLLTFDVSPDQEAPLAELQCHLRINEDAVETYGSGVFVPRAIWQGPQKQAQTDSAEGRVVNQLLSDIRAGHLHILQQLVRAEISPTAAAIRHHWISGEPIAPRLLHVFESYLTALEALPVPDQKANRTLIAWHLSYRYVTRFLQAQGHQELMLPSVGIGWAKAYYQWLRSRSLSANFSISLVGQVRDVLQFAVENELLEGNPLSSLKLGWKYGKPINCLSKEQLGRLHTESFPRTLDIARQWALFCCYTALDYVDAVALMADPDPHIHRGSYGEKLVWQRLKVQQVYESYPQWAICHIPLLEEARELLPTLRSLRKPSLNRMNLNLKLVGEQLELPFRFTTKICRKTAGALFIHRGYRMEVVQKIMGVKNFSTLERHYLTTWSEVVDDNMQRLQNWEKDRRK